MGKCTYFCQPIYPFWNWFPSQLVTNILAKMVAILNNQVICITMVACSMLLHELSNLNGIQACRPNKYWLSELEAWTLPRFHLKNTTCWVVMSSKCIFYTMNCKNRVWAMRKFELTWNLRVIWKKKMYLSKEQKTRWRTKENVTR